MLSFFHWLAQTPLSISMAKSRYDFAMVEMVHLLGLALLGGSILITDLSALGLIRLRQSPADLAKALLPATTVGLLTMLITGSLLVIDGPLRYYANVPFRVKMLLLVTAALLTYTRLSLAPQKGASRLPDRIIAVLSLALWLGVALAGRAIGVL
jgi:hypothetical protein